SVQFRGPATTAAPTFTGGNGVAFLWNHGGDTATAELAADRAGRIRLVRDHRVRAGAGPAPAVAGHVDIGQYFSEHRAVIALPAGDHIRQRSAAAVDGTVDLGRQPTA